MVEPGAGREEEENGNRSKRNPVSSTRLRNYYRRGGQIVSGCYIE